MGPTRRRFVHFHGNLCRLRRRGSEHDHFELEHLAQRHLVRLEIRRSISIARFRKTIHFHGGERERETNVGSKFVRNASKACDRSRLSFSLFVFFSRGAPLFSAKSTTVCIHFLKRKKEKRERERKTRESGSLSSSSFLFLFVFDARVEICSVN